MSKITSADIRSINESVLSSHDHLTAVFVGATNGIGFGTLKAFVTHIKHPRAVLVGRSETDFAPKARELKQINPYLELTFIESDISLLKNVDKASDEIVKIAPKSINLLYLSAGFINFGARDETQEGFDKCQALRYHIRLRFTINLLPHLATPFARVISILAGGQEAEIIYDDLELRRPGNYTIGRAGTTATTMTSLMFERLAKANPQIGFIHIYPGLVKTNVLSSSMGNGILGFLTRWIVQPLLSFFSTSLEESGERMLCYATSDKFSGPGAAEGQTSVRVAKPTVEQFWILNPDGTAAQKEKVLEQLRSEDGERKVWQHTEAEWKRVLG